jgi:tetratricopeptide (TPR) repeat protein
VGFAVRIACTLILLALPAYYVGYTLVAQPTAGGGIPLTSGPCIPIDSLRAGTSLPQSQATVLNETINYISAHTDPQDTIFAFNTPQLYFLAHRRNASRQDKIIPSLAEAWAEQQLVEDLRENKPRLILVTPSEARRYLTALHLLRDEIVQNYQLVSTMGTTYILERGTTFSSPYSSLGLVYEIAGEEEQAVSEYRNALATDPDDQVARERLALMYFRRGNTNLSAGRMEAAASAYQEAISLEPSNAQIHEALGRLYREQNLLSQAAYEYERAIGLDPTGGSAHRGLGLTYERLGRSQDAMAAYQEALALYEKAIELDPTDAAAYDDLGLTYEQLGRFEEAVSAYQEAVRLDPSVAQTHERLGRVYREQGRSQEAVGEYERTITLDPARASAHWGLGLTYQRLGRFQEALEAYEEAVRIDPADKRAQRGLEELSAVGEIRHPLWRNLGEMFALLGYDVQPNSVKAGETVQLTLWWEMLAGMDRDYTVFIHVLGPDGRILVQQDRLLVRDGRGTSDWLAGWIARTSYELELPPQTPAGRYFVKVGMYY